MAKIPETCAKCKFIFPHMMDEVTFYLCTHKYSADDDGVPMYVNRHEQPPPQCGLKQKKGLWSRIFGKKKKSSEPAEESTAPVQQAVAQPSPPPLEQRQAAVAEVEQTWMNRADQLAKAFQSPHLKPRKRRTPPADAKE